MPLLSLLFKSKYTTLLDSWFISTQRFYHFSALICPSLNPNSLNRHTQSWILCSPGSMEKKLPTTSLVLTPASDDTGRLQLTLSRVTAEPGFVPQGRPYISHTSSPPSYHAFSDTEQPQSAGQEFLGAGVYHSSRRSASHRGQSV